MNPLSQNQTSAVEFAGASRVHVALYASDIPRAVGFYRTLFGVEPVKVRDDYAKFEVADPSLNLALNLAPASAAGRLSHLGVQVKSTGAVAEAVARFEAAGLPVEIEEATTCCYAVQDKVWVTDPDGNRWEVFVVLDADAATHSGAEPASCCAPASACCTPECCVEEAIA